MLPDRVSHSAVLRSSVPDNVCSTIEVILGNIVLGHFSRYWATCLMRAHTMIAFDGDVCDPRS